MDPIARQRLAVLASFYSKLGRKGSRFATIRGGKPDGNGIIQFPYFALTKAASAFVDACYATGVVRPDFDWTAWKDTHEAQAFAGDMTAVDMATPEQIDKLLTTLIRQDRFVEGTLQDAHKTGFLGRILARAQTLASVESAP